MPTEPSRRIAGLDLARSAALVGMAVYHFGYDLEMFGVVAPATMLSPFWAGFARAVADRVIFMDEGEIVEDAPPAEFFSNPRSERTRLFLAQILNH